MSKVENSDKQKDKTNNDKETSENNETYNNSDDQYTNYNAEWSNQHEQILVEWGDKAICYRWLHSQSHNNYSFKNRWFTVPVIILSTLTGTANFAQERIPENFQPIFQLLVGSLNIFAGILTTIQQFLKVSELNEAHRVSSISWDKFYRNIKLELGKSKIERMPAYQMLKISKEEFDRLMETSPSIAEHVIKSFYATFQGKEGSNKRRIFEELKKPDICDTIVSANNTRHKWYLQTNNENEDDHQKEDFIMRQSKLLEQTEKKLLEVSQNQEQTEKERIRRHHDKMEKTRKEESTTKQKYQASCIKINKHIRSFYDMYSRKPLKDELLDNLKDDIDEDDLRKYLSNYNDNGDLDKV